VLLTYSGQPDLSRKVIVARSLSISRAATQSSTLQRVRLGVLGAGNFANATLLPVLKGMEQLDRVGIASGSGVSARTSADRFGFAYCTTDSKELLSDPDVNTVAILTRHNLHARQVIAGLAAGKHVFVEKPLCLTDDELHAITIAYQAAAERASCAGSVSPMLTVGFNRRFAPFVVELKQQLGRIREPLILHYRVNAGYIPPQHWTQDPAQGGGRLLGEGCHFIDLLIYLAGSAPRKITTQALPDGGRYAQDNLLITLEFANGSLGSITYVANGDKGFGKEFLEIFGGGLSARLDDYRTLRIRQGKQSVERVARLRQDKGHRAEWQALVAHLTGRGAVPIAFEDIVGSTKATLAAQRSLLAGEPVLIGWEEQHQ